MMEIILALILLLILASQGGCYKLQKKQIDNQERLMARLDLILKEMKKG